MYRQGASSVMIFLVCLGLYFIIPFLATLWLAYIADKTFSNLNQSQADLIAKEGCNVKSRTNPPFLISYQDKEMLQLIEAQLAKSNFTIDYKSCKAVKQK
jgi:hypothetical protein